MPIEVKPITTWSHAFSRARRWLCVFASSSDWFLVLLLFVLISQSGYYTELKTALKALFYSLGVLQSSGGVWYAN